MSNNHINHKILAPSVHFLAFNLQESDIIKLKANRRRISKDWLWETCDNIVSTTLQQNFTIKNYLDLNKEPNNFYVVISNTKSFDARLHNNNNFYIPEAIPLQGTISFRRNNLEIEGFAYPVIIDNSYALWLNLSHPKQQNEQITAAFDTELLRHFNPNNCFLRADEKGYFGQAIIISAWLTSDDTRKSNQELKEIADECLKNFLPDNYTIPPFNRMGELFGSPVFQYGLEKELPSSGNIFVCLFRSNKTPSNLYKARSLLLKLFFYRAQIIKHFQEVKRYRRLVDKMHTKIVSEINSLLRLGKNNTLSKDDLNQLQGQLKILPLRAEQYEEFRAGLNISKNKIDQSVTKYKGIVEKIAAQFEYEDISFLETLSNTNWPFYQERIEASLIYFEHGSRLIDNAVSSIRGQIAIEQTELSSRRLEVQEENNRTLQQRITALGFGLSIGSILSQIIANEIFSPEFILLKQVAKNRVISDPYYYITATTFCLIISIVSAFAFDIILTLFPRIRHNIYKLLGKKKDK